MYILKWKNPDLDTNKATPINVPVGSVVSDKSSLRFTGKGAADYGSIQQENLMRLLENFADKSAPLHPTVGQEWFDTSKNSLQVCTAVSGESVIWKSLGGIQIADTPPNPATLGDIWFQRNDDNSGVLYIYTGTGRFPTDDPTAIGGWNQIWPTVETVAGREEYDSILSMVNELMGEALTKIFPAFPNFAALDLDLNKKVDNSDGELKVDAISTDWDMLLAAAKYAVSRLDLPSGMVEDISAVPFVSDGQPAPAVLTTLPQDDVRYPTLDRRLNRRFGMITLMRAFSETVNVLKAAVANKYALKGINGATGTNAAFASNVQVINHATFMGSPAGASAETLTMKFNFASTEQMQSFMNSGGAIQVTLSHTGSGTSTDSDLRDLFNSRGILRFSADKTRLLSNTAPPALTVAPISLGLKNAPAAGQILTTQTLGTATMSVATGVISPTQLSITITLSGQAINGTTKFVFQVIRDNTTYNAPAVTGVFGAPIAYAEGDKTGSAFLV